MTIKQIFSISRPRFWLYTAGPFAVGYVLGLTEPTKLSSLQFWIYLLYFLLPANIFLYGINDFWDHDTDQYNAKKGIKEHKLLKQERTQLARILSVTVAISFVLFFLSSHWIAASILGIFILLSYSYSAPPIRFKSKPILDSGSNILYALPGFLGYFLTTGSLPSINTMLACWTWCSAMHLFSAIPDIEPDQKAGLMTTAVKYGKRKSLLICTSLWLISYFMLPSAPIYKLALVYPALPLLIYFNKFSINKMYWYFPWITGILGTVIWWNHAIHWL